MIEEERAVVFNAEMSQPNITLICVQQTRVGGGGPKSFQNGAVELSRRRRRVSKCFWMMSIAVITMKLLLR